MNWHPTDRASGPAVQTTAPAQVAIGPTVFVDRDGVINAERRDYVRRWTHFRFLPGALEGLAMLSQQGGRVLVVTNQSAINRGLMTVADLEEIHCRMAQVVAEAGGRIDAIYCCPHRPDEGCDCRKPRPGLLLWAAREYGLDLSQSFLVGDKCSDVAAGEAVGCTCVMVRTGLPDAMQPPEPCPVLDDLPAAARWILGRMPRGAR
jgi:D-glycero-D-manno-heptose 1,7-bisphosphate phosphatase